MQDNIVVMPLRAGLDHLLEIINVNGFRSQADKASRIDSVGCIIGTHDELRIVGGRLIAAGAIGRFCSKTS